MPKKSLKTYLLLACLLVSFNAHAITANCSDALANIELGSKVQSFETGIIPFEELGIPAHPSVPVKYVSIQTVNGQQYTEDQLFNDKSDLIIGIDTTGKTKGHMYLIINGVARVDGRMFYAPSTVDQKNLQLSNGLILRYKNLPPENKQKLLAWLSSPADVHGPTCVSVGSKIVFEVAELAPANTRDYWFPSTFLTYIATNGLVTESGTHVKPDIYLLNSEIHMFWNSLPRWKSVPKFLVQVLFDPYTWQGLKNRHRDRPDPSIP